VSRVFRDRPPFLSRDRKVTEHVAVEDVSLSLGAGERLALVGESGSGKTTLARLLTGLTAPGAGSIRYRGVDLTTLDAAGWSRFRGECRMVFQNVWAMLNPLLRIREILDEPMTTHTDWDQDQRLDRMETVLDEVGGHRRWLDHYPHQLSGGERRRVALARALAVPPRLLVADEPVSGLDVVLQHEILEILDVGMAATGGALVVISHDLAVVERLCRRILILYAGRVVEEIAPARGIHPVHPYSRLLFRASHLLRDLEGRGPAGVAERDPATDRDLSRDGCVFRGRCDRYSQLDRREDCDAVVPPLVERPGGGRVACHHWELGSVQEGAR
jgi:ABC-type glutathione transport system ATPase component